MKSYNQNDLIAQQLTAGERWHEFLSVADLSTGLYILPAGAKDLQQPHSEDEVYYVISGRGQIHVDGEDEPVEAGSIVYVAAHDIHYFHSIVEELRILVFFAPAEHSLHQRRQTAVHEQLGYELDTRRSRLNIDWIYTYLSEVAYWSHGCSRETVEKAIANSLCYALYKQKTGRQVAFARVITDYATFAYIADVFVDEAHRGRGLATWLLRTMLAHPDIQGVRKWTLFTRDAHPLYRQLGFDDPVTVPTFMEFRP